MDEDKHRERLRFRSWHRGTREMDLLLGSFADVHLHGFTPEQLDDYEKLLTESDPDLYNWITGAEPVPAAQDSDVMRLLCAHRFAGMKSA
ncbi:MAG: succinate dehydrogenase assembly factor 2 [Alphaproteobacteria bacterium]|nr:succinate dehydrogenase assembly factor 2 [Alphaproteobacteria bacterium]